jgi:hypothetical protein
MRIETSKGATVYITPGELPQFHSLAESMMWKQQPVPASEKPKKNMSGGAMPPKGHRKRENTIIRDRIIDVITKNGGMLQKDILPLIEWPLWMDKTQQQLKLNFILKGMTMLDYDGGKNSKVWKLLSTS